MEEGTMKNNGIKVGDKLIAVKFCGFPDGTTEGKVYTVTRIESGWNQKLFFIKNDEDREVLPISTVFKKLVNANE
jgi:hypothetical protein